MILPITLNLNLIQLTPSTLANYLYNTTMCIIEPIVILDIYLGLK